ncbi:MAG TPA: MFS transporter [Caldimonas sp.]|jgi:MFS family permease|nr:MFS transporter [Caldimonas sp.]HEX2540170.1 MFS transporter [Caldimonas sp.]
MLKNGADASGGSSARLALGVLALCFLFNFIGRGVGDTYMVFLLPLGAEFGWLRTEMTSVYSTLMITSGLAAPLGGMVFERWGPRVLYAGGLGLLGTGYFLAGRLHELWQFYLCIGILGGLGAAAVGMVPAAALISRWFRGRMTTALGLAYAGFGCGSLLIVPFAQTLIDSRGWRSAYGVLGAVLLVLLPLSLALPWRAIRAGLPTPGPRPVPSPAPSPAPTGSAATTARPVRAALGQRSFWLLVQVMFFTAVGMYLIIVQSVAYLVDVGFTPLQAAGAFGVAGLLSVIGMSSAGWLADRFGHRRAATISFIGTTIGILLLFAMSYRSTHWLLAAYVLLFGICQGARGPLIAGLSARLFSGPGQSTIYGVIYACMSVGSGIGALLSGTLHDLTGGYRAAFVLAMVCVLLAALPFWTSDRLVPADTHRAK